MANIKEKYQISYGLQHGPWELELHLPEWEEYGTEEEVRKWSENREVSALLTADAIFLSFDGTELEIFPEQTESYSFSLLKKETYERLGPPLSPEDLDRLIGKDMLEEVIFSSRYMVTENDYREFPGSLAGVFIELGQSEEPLCRKTDDGRERYGYLFESVWYQAGCVR